MENNVEQSPQVNVVKLFFFSLVFIQLSLITNLMAQPSASNFASRYQLLSRSFEGAISPENYVLGPGDVLVYALWGEKSVSFTLPVTPQGKLILPNIGDFEAGGKTLSEVKAILDKRIQEVFTPRSTSLTLKSVRTFRVHVVGEVNRAGDVIVSAIDRVSDAIALAGGLTKKSSIRDIQIIPQNGKEIQVDLLEYERLGNLSANPTLRDGDIVVVPVASHRISVSGAVLRPGDFEWVPGETVAEAIRLAGGLAPNASHDSITVARFLSDGQTIRKIYVTAIDSASPVFWKNFRLISDDRIYVREIQLWHKKRSVKVIGEVLYPGEYAINKGSTHLKDIIKRAGGFTSEASLIEAKVLRGMKESRLDPEFERLKKMQVSEMTEMEYEYFKLKSREISGRMSVDFVRLFAMGDSTQNIALRDGDQIIVPRRKNFVRVSGQVLFPGNVIYHSAWKIRDYIRYTGGFNWNARKSKIRIIRAQTGEWLKPKQVKQLVPGDVIWVPGKPVRDYWKLFREIMLAASQAATVYLVVKSALGK